MKNLIIGLMLLTASSAFAKVQCTLGGFEAQGLLNRGVLVGEHIEYNGVSYQLLGKAAEANLARQNKYTLKVSENGVTNYHSFNKGLVITKEIEGVGITSTVTCK